MVGGRSLLLRFNLHVYTLGDIHTNTRTAAELAFHHTFTLRPLSLLRRDSLSIITALLFLTPLCDSILVSSMVQHSRKFF